MGNTINIDKYVGIGFRGIIPSAIDPSAAAYFTATGITGATQQTAIDNLVKGLKADGLWSKMKAVYPFVTDNRNLLGYTEDFGNAYWAKNNATITTNSVTAPNGLLTADSLVDNSTNAVHSIAVQQTLTNANYTYSIYCKKANRDWAWIALYDGSVSRFAYFNLATGAIGNVDSGATATITDATNGWYRCTLSMPMTTSVNNYANTGSAIANGSSAYLGNGTTATYLWGAQLELGSTATTYQPIATTQQSFISSQFKYNLVNPVDSDAAFRLVFNGGWTHSSTGATPNGTNGYADTRFIPNTALTLNSGHLSFYSRTNNTTGIDDFSTVITGDTQNMRILINAVGSLITDLNSINQRITVANADSLGFYQVSRTSSTSLKVYKNAITFGTNTSTNTGTQPITSIYLGAANRGGNPINYSNRQCAFASLADGLTDTEAANLYTRVQAFNQALSRQVGVPIVSDADAQAFLNSAEITDITQANAINTLVTDLKAQGLWSKMKAIYPFVGGTASTHKYNLKDPRDLDAAYRLVFNGGWTHSSTGATPNGTNGYADTKLNILNTLSLTNSHHSAYLRTNYAISTLGAFGAESATTTRMSFFPYTFSVGWISDIYDNSQSRISSNTGNSTGYVIGSRASTSSHKLFRNGTQIASTTNDTNGSRPNLNYWIGGYNVSNALQFPIASQLSLYSIGDGLTDTEATALYNAVNNFQVALSRQVP